jgi:hypothetical protein
VLLRVVVGMKRFPSSSPTADALGESWARLVRVGSVGMGVHDRGDEGGDDVGDFGGAAGGICSAGRGCSSCAAVPGTDARRKVAGLLVVDEGFGGQVVGAFLDAAAGSAPVRAEIGPEVLHRHDERCHA